MLGKLLFEPDVQVQFFLEYLLDDELKRYGMRTNNTFMNDNKLCCVDHFNNFYKACENIILQGIDPADLFANPDLRPFQYIRNNSGTIRYLTQQESDLPVNLSFSPKILPFTQIPLLQEDCCFNPHSISGNFLFNGGDKSVFLISNQGISIWIKIKFDVDDKFIFKDKNIFMINNRCDSDVILIVMREND
jgi:hypothetical protein